MGKKKSGDDSDGGGELIAKPHPHDVLCGRGGLTNQHTGNEWFRRLVRSNRPLYRSCPKHTKLLVAKAIVQAVQQQEPSGRFLELADRNEGLWKQISYKRAVDKTSQALREKDPPPAKGGTGSAMPAMDPPLQLPDGNIQSEAAAAARKAAARKGKRKEEDLADLAQATLKQAGFIGDKQNKVTPASAILPPPVDLGKKRKPNQKQDFIKPSWWGRTSGDDSQPQKKAKMTDDPVAPPPPEPLQTRQSSLFRFLSNTSIFGGGGSDQQQQQLQQQNSNSFFSFGSGNNNNNMAPDAASFQSSGNVRPVHRMSFQMSGQVPPPPDPNLQQMGSSTFLLDPLPINGQQQQQAQQRQDSFGSQQAQQQQQQQQQQQPQNNFGNQPDQIQQMQQQMQERMQQMQMHMQRQMQMQMEQLRRQSFENQGGVMKHNNKTNNNINNPMMGSSSNNMNPRNSLRTSMLDNSNPFGSIDNPQAAFQNNPMGGSNQQQEIDDAPLPVNRLSSQVSDWLTSFWPLGKDGEPQQPAQEAPPPPPEAAERSVSSTLINFARSPSNFLTTLRSGVSGLFNGDNDDGNNMNNSSNNGGLNPTGMPATSNSIGTQPPSSNSFSAMSAAGNASGGGGGSGPVIGTASQGSSLLDDYEESPLETRLRTGVSG